LLIESAGSRREALQNFLERCGYSVESAADGATGLRKAMAWRPAAAVVATDIQPAGGYAEAFCLREALGKEIVLITRTRPGQPVDRQRARAAGFDHLLTADADPAELHEFLQAANADPVA
jgi:CheY-like chemotaxis protein